MNTSRRGEIVTLITTAVVILIGITTFVTTTILNKKNNKIAYKSRAAAKCDRECLQLGGTNEECCYKEASPPVDTPVPAAVGPDERPTQPPPQHSSNCPSGTFEDYPGGPCIPNSTPSCTAYCDESGPCYDYNKCNGAQPQVTQPPQPTKAPLTLPPEPPKPPPSGKDHPPKCPGPECNRCGENGFWNAECDRFVVQKGADDAPYAANYLWKKQVEEMKKQAAAQAAKTSGDQGNQKSRTDLSYTEALRQYNTCLFQNRQFGQEDAEAICEGVKPTDAQKEGSYRIVIPTPQPVPTTPPETAPMFVDEDGALKPIFLLSQKKRDEIEKQYGKIPGAHISQWDCNGDGRGDNNCDKCGWAGWWQAGCGRFEVDHPGDATQAWQRDVIEECGGAGDVILMDLKTNKGTCRQKEAYLENPQGKIPLFTKDNRRECEQNCSRCFPVAGGEYFACEEDFPKPTVTAAPVSLQLAQQNIFSEDACRIIQRQKDGRCFPVEVDGKKYFRYVSEEDTKKEQELAKQKKEVSAVNCQRTCEERDYGRCIVTPLGESECVFFNSMAATKTTVSGSTGSGESGSGGGQQNCGGRWQKPCSTETMAYGGYWKAKQVKESFCKNGYKPVVDSVCIPDEGYEKAQAVSTYLKTYVDTNKQINQKDISLILSNLDGSSKQYLPEITKNFCGECIGECIYSDVQRKFACISSSDIANKYYKEEETGKNGELYGSCNFTLGPIGSACNHEDLTCNSAGKCQLTSEGLRLIANDVAMKSGLVSAQGQSINFQYLSPDKMNDLIGKKELVSAKEVCKNDEPSWQNGACFQCADSQNGYVTQTVADFCADPELAKKYARLPGGDCRSSGGYCAEGSGDKGSSDCPGGFSCRSDPPYVPPADPETDGTIKIAGLGRQCDNNFTARCADGLKCWNGTCQDTTILAYNDEYQNGSWHKAVKDIPLIGGMVAPLTTLFNGDLSHAAYIRARNAQTQIEKIQTGEETGNDAALRIFQTLDGAAKGQFFQFELDKAYAQGKVDPLSAVGMKVFSNLGTIVAGYHGETGGNPFVEYGETAAGSQDILERAKGAVKMGGQTAFMVGDVLTLGTSGLIARGGVAIAAQGVKIGAGTALKEIGVRAALSGIKEVAEKEGKVAAAKAFFSEIPRAAASNVLKGTGAVLKAVDTPRAASEALVKKVPLLKAPETLAAVFVLPAAIVTQKGVGAAVKAAPILLKAAEKVPRLGRVALPIAGRLNDNIARGATDQAVSQAVKEGKQIGPSLVRSAYGTAQKEGFQGTASEFRRIFFDRIRTPSTTAIEGNISKVTDGFMQIVLDKGGALTGKKRDEYILNLAKQRAKNAKIPVTDSIAQAKGAYEAIDFARKWGIKNTEDIRAVAAIMKEAKTSGAQLTKEEAFEQFAKKINGSAKETAQKAHLIVEGLLFEKSPFIKQPPGITDWFAAKLSGFFASSDQKLVNELAQQSGFAAVKGDSLVSRNLHVEVDGKIASLEQYVDQAPVDEVALAYKRSDGKVWGIKRRGDSDYISTELTSDLKWPSQPRSVATSRTLDGLLPKTSNITEIMIGKEGTLGKAAPIDEIINGSFAKHVERLKKLAKTDEKALREELINRGISDTKKNDDLIKRMRSAKPAKAKSEPVAQAAKSKTPERAQQVSAKNTAIQNDTKALKAVAVNDPSAASNEVKGIIDNFAKGVKKSIDSKEYIAYELFDKDGKFIGVTVHNPKTGTIVDTLDATGKRVGEGMVGISTPKELAPQKIGGVAEIPYKDKLEAIKKANAHQETADKRGGIRFDRVSATGVVLNKTDPRMKINLNGVEVDDAQILLRQNDHVIITRPDGSVENFIYTGFKKGDPNDILVDIVAKEADTTTLGRSTAPDFFISLNISRQHADISMDPSGRMRLIGRETTNGTTIYRQGKQIDIQPAQEVVLQPGDKVAFGHKYYEYVETQGGGKYLIDPYERRALELHGAKGRGALRDRVMGIFDDTAVKKLSGTKKSFIQAPSKVKEQVVKADVMIQRATTKRLTKVETPSSVVIEKGAAFENTKGKGKPVIVPKDEEGVMIFDSFSTYEDPWKESPVVKGIWKKAEAGKKIPVEPNAIYNINGIPVQSVKTPGGAHRLVDLRTGEVVYNLQEAGKIGRVIDNLTGAKNRGLNFATEKSPATRIADGVKVRLNKAREIVRGEQKVALIPDCHSDYDGCLAYMRELGVIDQNGNPTGKRAVIAGDVYGKATKKLVDKHPFGGLDLHSKVIELQERTGGAVEFIGGNWEPRMAQGMNLVQRWQKNPKDYELRRHIQLFFGTGGEGVKGMKTLPFDEVLNAVGPDTIGRAVHNMKKTKWVSMLPDGKIVQHVDTAEFVEYIFRDEDEVIQLLISKEGGAELIPDILAIIKKRGTKETTQVGDLKALKKAIELIGWDREKIIQRINTNVGDVMVDGILRFNDTSASNALWKLSVDLELELGFVNNPQLVDAYLDLFNAKGVVHGHTPIDDLAKKLYGKLGEGNRYVKKVGDGNEAKYVWISTPGVYSNGRMIDIDARLSNGMRIGYDEKFDQHLLQRGVYSPPDTVPQLVDIPKGVPYVVVRDTVPAALINGVEEGARRTKLQFNPALNALTCLIFGVCR